MALFTIGNLVCYMMPERSTRYMMKSEGVLDVSVYEKGIEGKEDVDRKSVPCTRTAGVYERNVGRPATGSYSHCNCITACEEDCKSDRCNSNPPVTTMVEDYEITQLAYMIGLPTLSWSTGSEPVLGVDIKSIAWLPASSRSRNDP